MLRSRPPTRSAPWRATCRSGLQGRTVVIGAGKAAVPMAKAVEDNWDGPLEGFVIAPHGYCA